MSESVTAFLKRLTSFANCVIQRLICLSENRARQSSSWEALSRIKTDGTSADNLFPQTYLLEKSINEITTIFKSSFKTHWHSNMNAIWLAHMSSQEDGSNRNHLHSENMTSHHWWFQTGTARRQHNKSAKVHPLAIFSTFCAAFYPTWAQKERKRAFLLTVSFSFC